jgi:hypothetical protein
VALEVLNATESYLWVWQAIIFHLISNIWPQRYIRGSGLAYGAYVYLDVESGLLSFSLYRVCPCSFLTPVSDRKIIQSSNSMEAYKEASKVLKGLVDGSVGCLTRCPVFDRSTLLDTIGDDNFRCCQELCRLWGRQKCINRFASCKPLSP